MSSDSDRIKQPAVQSDAFPRPAPQRVVSMTHDPEPGIPEPSQSLPRPESVSPSVRVPSKNKTSQTVEPQASASLESTATAARYDDDALDKEVPRAAEIGSSELSGSDHLKLFRYNGIAMAITGAVLVLILLIGAGTLFLNGRQASQDSLGSRANDYAFGSSLPLGQVKGQLPLDSADQLSVNGQLKINDTLVVTPTAKPAIPVTGQIYYDKVTNQPYYYDGKQFISLAPQGGVTSLGGATGAVGLGSGLVISGGQLTLSNSVLQQLAATSDATIIGRYVATLQGQSGNVTLGAGPGISINGTAISNSGVIGLASGSGNLVISDDGAGHYTITDTGSGGGVTSLDGLTGVLTLNNSSGTGSAITIDNASTSQKGIAQFDSTNFQAGGGVINTIQDIATTSAPSFAGLTVNGPTLIQTISPTALEVTDGTNTALQVDTTDSFIQLGNTSQDYLVDIEGTLTSNRTINGSVSGAAAFSTTLTNNDAGLGNNQYVAEFDNLSASGSTDGILHLLNLDTVNPVGAAITIEGPGAFTNIINNQGVLISGAELNLLDGHTVPLLDQNSNLNGSNIGTGTVADARLSTNVALLNATQNFTGINTFSGAGTALSVTHDASIGGVLQVTGNVVSMGNLIANQGTSILTTTVGSNCSAADAGICFGSSINIYNYNNGTALKTDGQFDAQSLFATGNLTFGTFNQTSFTTPLGHATDTKINIPLYDPGNASQFIAIGLPSGSSSTARAITVFDARSVSGSFNQPPIGVISPDENNIFGLAWEGSNTTAYVYTTGGGITLQSGATPLLQLGSAGNATITGNTNTTGVFQVNGTSGVSSGTACTTGQHLQVLQTVGGLVTSQNGCQAGADYAENYVSSQALVPGEVVAVDHANPSQVVRSAGAGQSDLVGVVSTQPGDVIGGPDGYPIALNGHVPVKVNLEGGAIEPGDKLTSSSVPGVAKKATSAGQILGTAMTAYDGSQPNATVDVFMGVGYDDPTPSGAYIQNGGNANLSGLNVSGTATFANLNVSGMATTSNLAVTGSATIASLAVTGSASFAGNITVGGHIITTGLAPAAQIQPAAGTGATCTVKGNDTGGSVTITTGTGGVADGKQCILVFQDAFANAPNPVIAPRDKASAQAQAFVDADTHTMTIEFSNAPAAGTAYTFNYFNTQ